MSYFLLIDIARLLIKDTNQDKISQYLKIANKLKKSSFGTMNSESMRIIRIIKPFYFVLAVSLFCLCVQFLAPESINLLRYQLNNVSGGEYWRIVTANFCHSNWNHLVLNLTGLILIDYLFQPFISQIQRIALFSFCVVTNVILLHNFIELSWYVGLSGALHGYLTGAALLSYSQSRKLAISIIVVVGIKLTLEMNWEVNTSTSKLIEANVVEEAHLSGAISAVIYYFILKIIQYLLNYYRIYYCKKS